MTVIIIRNIVILSILSFFFRGCPDKYELIYSKVITANIHSSREDTIIKDPGTNFYFSRLTKAGSSGLQFVYEVPPEYQNRAMYVVLKGRARTNYAISNSGFVLITVDKEGKQLCWKTLALKTCYLGTGNWSLFYDSIKLPKNFDNKKYVGMNCFACLGNSKHEQFDIDTVSVQIKIKAD